MPTPQLTTERLILREFLESDATALMELESDPEVLKYIGTPVLTSPDQCREIIASIRRQYERVGIGRWVVSDKFTGRFLGWAGLKYEEEVRPEKAYWDLGYRLVRRSWGKGYATEASAEWLRYGFRVMKLPMIGAAAHIENAGSNRVLEKLGFQKAGKFTPFGSPHFWYELRQHEWQQTR